MGVIGEVAIAVTAVISAAITALVTWLLGKRKSETEADTTIVSGANYAVDAMVSVVAELRNQVENIKIEGELLRAENTELKEQVRALSRENARLADEIERVTALFLESRCPTCETDLS